MNPSDTQHHPSKGKVQVGDMAPDFMLPDQSGRPVRLSDFLGKTAVVLYFYPKDHTGGCTREACAFRDSYEVFREAGAEVIGVSSDSSESHQQFASQNRLPFILLSDTGGVLRKRYGVAKKYGLFAGRVTYVIDRQGVVRHIFFDQFNPTQHVAEALAILKG